jgi:glycosyltransferase 2 family protein
MTFSARASISRMPSRAHARAIVVSVLGLALLVALIWYANPSRVLHAVRDADPAWIGLAVAAILLSTILGAFNSYLMAAPGPTLKFAGFLRAYWVAWAFGQVIPGQIGDLLGMSLFLKRRGLTLPTAMGRLGVDKLLSLWCTLALSGGLFFLYAEPPARLAGMLGCGAAMALILAYLTSRKWGARVRLDQGLAAHVAGILTEAHRVIATRPRAVAANALLTVVKLFVIGICYWAVFRALHAVPGGMLDVTITANSAGLIAYVPISANGVGTVEAGGVYLFGLRHLAPPLIIAAYLVLRFANLALAWGGTAIVLLASLWSRRAHAP